MEESYVINFDGRCLQDPGYRSSGIGNYSRWLFEKVVASQRFDVKLACELGGEQIAGLPNDVAFETIALKDMRSGIYVNPSFMTHSSEPYDLAGDRRLTRIGVLHDLIPIRRPKESSDYDLRLFKRMLDKSLQLDGVVTNSHCTMLDYLDWRGTYLPTFVVHPESRFVVASADVSRTTKAVATMSKTTPPYVFFAVADHPRKNIELALHAASALWERGFATIVGGGISAATIEYFSRSHDLSMITFTPRLTDRDLVDMYVGAEAVVVPSYDEGFSLPVFEALNLGCRVLLSDIPAHREQVLDSKHFFNPQDPDGFITCFQATASCTGTSHVKFDHSTEIACFLDWLRNYTSGKK